MAHERLRVVEAFALVALMIFAAHIYAERQAYKTGVYMGKSFFDADDYQNRVCLRVRADSFEPVCRVIDLSQDSVMEDALASAWIIPSLADSTALHTGFRDGWRKERTAAFRARTDLLPQAR